MLFTKVGAGTITIFDVTAAGGAAADGVGKYFAKVGVFVGAATAAPVSFTITDKDGNKMHTTGREPSVPPGAGVAFEWRQHTIAKVEATFAGDGTVCVAPYAKD